MIFVGNLPGDVREREIEDLFYKVTKSSLLEIVLTLSPGSLWWIHNLLCDLLSERSVFRDQKFISTIVACMAADPIENLSSCIALNLE